MIPLVTGWRLWAGAGLVLAGAGLYVAGLGYAGAIYDRGYAAGWQDAQAALTRAAADTRERIQDAPLSTGDLDADLDALRDRLRPR